MPDRSVAVLTPVGPRWDPRYLQVARDVLDLNDTVLEWVVVCDGSDPGHVRDAVGADPRIRVIGSAVNRGTAHARNTGLAQASGEWIYAFDADDVPLAGGIDLLVAAAQAQSAVWSAGLAYDVAADGETVVYKPPVELAPFHTTIPVGGFLAQADRTGVYPVLCSGATLLSTEVARGAGGWDEFLRTVSEDVSLIAWISERHPGAWCDDYVMAYRKHPASMTATGHGEVAEAVAARRVRRRARVDGSGAAGR